MQMRIEHFSKWTEAVRIRDVRLSFKKIEVAQIELEILSGTGVGCGACKARNEVRHRVERVGKNVKPDIEAPRSVIDTGMDIVSRFMPREAKTVRFDVDVADETSKVADFKKLKM